MYRGLAQALQHPAPALVAGLSTTGTGGDRLACSNPRVSFTRNAHLGAAADHTLTSNPDHITGAGQESLWHDWEVTPNWTRPRRMWPPTLRCHS